MSDRHGPRIHVDHQPQFENCLQRAHSTAGGHWGGASAGLPTTPGGRFCLANALQTHRYRFSLSHSISLRNLFNTHTRSQFAIRNAHNWTLICKLFFQHSINCLNIVDKHHPVPLYPARFCWFNDISSSTVNALCGRHSHGKEVAVAFDSHFESGCWQSPLVVTVIIRCWQHHWMR